METYNVFRKTFHVPKEWMKDQNMLYLVNHTYAKENAAESFDQISKRLKESGYMEDNDRMIHDYLHFMIQDLFDKNNEIYITENIIRTNNDILALLNNCTPDFVLKKNDQRTKTAIIDIYVGEKPISEVKNKYKSLSYFADVYIVTQYDFTKQLKHVLPEKDIDYLYKNFQIFLTEYYYWRACIKLRKILYNDKENVILQDLPDVNPNIIINRDKFVYDLANYAKKVADQENI